MSGRGLLICGYYGFGNAGDEAILAAMIAHLRAERPGLPLRVISGDPGRTQAMHPVTAVHWQDIGAIAASVRDAGLVVIGGGGLFHDYWGVDPDTLLTPEHWGVGYPATVALLAALERRPLMLYGVGVGPLASQAARDLTATVCETASAITVRDEASLELLRALGVPASKLRLAADPVFAIDAGRPARAREAGTIVVSLRHWDRGVDQDHWLGVVAEVLRSTVDATGGRLVLLPFQGLASEAEDDGAICRRVASLIDRPASVEVCAAPDGPDEILELLSGVDLVLGMRLHAVILAARAGVPVISLSYDAKVGAAMRQLGWERESCRLGELEADSLASRVLAALADRDRLVQLARERLPRLEVLARSSAADALRLLDAGSPETLGARARAVLAAGAEGLIRRNADLARSLSSEREHAAASLEEARREVEELNASVARQDAALRETRREVEHLNALLDEAHDTLQAAKVEAERVLAELTAQQRRDVESLRREVEAWRASHDSAQEAIAYLQGELARWRASKWWRVATAYWRQLERLQSVKRRLLRMLPGRRASSGEVEAPSPGAEVGASEAAGPARKAESVELPEGFPSCPSGRYDVVVFSIIDWDFRFQRPQQLATQFGRHGHRVFYLSTSSFLPAGERAAALTLKAPNVAEVRLRTPMPLDIYGGRLLERDLDALESDFAELAEASGMGDAVAMVQIPFWAPIAERLRARLGWRLVYDCMDEWGNFPGFGPAVLALEEPLVSGADLTVVSGDCLEAKFRDRARSLVLAKNAVDLTHYRERYGDNRLLGGLTHPVIGYFGALASWVDAPLLARLSETFPESSVVLAGGVFDVDLSDVESRRNVRLLGQRPYEEMPQLLWHYDVCMIPFQINDITHATNPVKFYEYCYSGKPIVAPDLKELRPFADVCYLARNNDEFIAHVRAALAEPEDDHRRARRREIAEANDWSQRYAVIDRAIGEAFPLVSVVVVCYGGLELTRACLASLLASETWPRLEVIVVDNASPDGTADFLRGFERRDPRVRAVLNDENRGFAAANNQGLALADGEVLVLLNNDTVVPPGLIGRLVAHLRRDEAIGLLCPTTNFCGNEAKIDAGYADLRGLPGFAARRARAYAGRTLDLETAAMYCVAMRRGVVDAVGPLDEGYGVGMFEDDDFSRRVRLAGFRVACAEDAYVHHVGQSAFAKLPREEYDAIWRRNQTYFEQKWGVSWRPHVTRPGVSRAEPKIK